MGNKLNCCNSCKEDNTVNFDKENINEGLNTNKGDNDDKISLHNLINKQKLKQSKTSANIINNNNSFSENKEQKSSSHNNIIKYREGNNESVDMEEKEEKEHIYNEEENNNNNNENENYNNKIRPSSPISDTDITEINKLKIYKKLNLNKTKIMNERKDTVIIQGRLKKAFEAGKNIKHYKDIYMVINKEKIRIYRSKELFLQLGRATETILVEDLIKIKLNYREDSFFIDYIVNKSSNERNIIELSGTEKGQLEEFIAVLYFLIVNVVGNDTKQ